MIKGDSTFAYIIMSGLKSHDFQQHVPVPAALVVEAGDKVVGFVGIPCVVGVFVPRKIRTAIKNKNEYKI